jgi:outer membrane protein OmpA-like peptidoglycan-associated protein
MTSFRTIGAAVVCVLWAVTASAQAQSQPAADSTESLRPATTTFSGDTGLWFVPTGEVLPQRLWSASLYRRGFNYPEGFTNVSDFAATFAYGVYRKMELFGSFKLITRIDRDLRPIFISDPDVGGVLSTYPGVKQGWSGNQIGDFSVGLKYNIWSEEQQRPMALGVRGAFKLPTGDEDSGASTGQLDADLDLVVSKEYQARVEYAGYAGFGLRGGTDTTTQTSTFRWGLGAGVPSRGGLRFTGEFHGELPFDDTMTPTPPFRALDNSLTPVSSDIHSFTALTAGVTWQSQGGFFVGGGLSWNFPGADRDDYVTDEDASGDFVDWQVRIGFHPGVRRYVPPPPPPPPPPTPPPANRPPTVTARCEPCTIEVGRTVTVTADAQDPDGDTLSYKWSGPAGTFTNPTDRQTIWTAPQQEGPVQLTVTVSDGKGGTASANVTIQVIRPKPIVELTFEDVYFDFDRSTLRPEALRLLDDAVAKLQANPTRNIVIEGHTCNIGTAEYNLALGERRANSVREYLTSRGVPAARLQTRSYGEERPRHDNSREETRRLNRRAALVVSVQ